VFGLSSAGQNRGHRPYRHHHNDHDSNYLAAIRGMSAPALPPPSSASPPFILGTIAATAAAAAAATDGRGRCYNSAVAVDVDDEASLPLTAPVLVPPSMTSSLSAGRATGMRSTTRGAGVSVMPLAHEHRYHLYHEEQELSGPQHQQAEIKKADSQDGYGEYHLMTISQPPLARSQSLPLSATATATARPQKTSSSAYLSSSSSSSSSNAFTAIAATSGHTILNSSVHATQQLYQQLQQQGPASYDVAAAEVLPQFEVAKRGARGDESETMAAKTAGLALVADVATAVALQHLASPARAQQADSRNNNSSARLSSIFSSPLPLSSPPPLSSTSSSSSSSTSSAVSAQAQELLFVPSSFTYGPL
jgi:hypothetical protein